jgi:periplasmic divalent cation tolerance protein
MVLTTVATEEQARLLARYLVEGGLAACVQLQPIRSVYRWKDEVFDEPEWRLAVKTTAERFEAVERHIKERHTYEMPEIVRVEITGGSAEYLRWIEESVARRATERRGKQK